MGEAAHFMNMNYRVALQYDPDGYWIAEHPELPGCKADGATPEEALASLEISKELWIESRLATGLEVPEPEEAPQFSGKFVLRIAKSMHKELAQEAEAEGVSLNTHISNVLASRHSVPETSNVIQQTPGWITNLNLTPVPNQGITSPQNVLRFPISGQHPDMNKVNPIQWQDVSGNKEGACA